MTIISLGGSSSLSYAKMMNEYVNVLYIIFEQYLISNISIYKLQNSI